MILLGLSTQLYYMQSLFTSGRARVYSVNWKCIFHRCERFITNYSTAKGVERGLKCREQFSKWSSETVHLCSWLILHVNTKIYTSFWTFRLSHCSKQLWICPITRAVMPPAVWYFWLTAHHLAIRPTLWRRQQLEKVMMNTVLSKSVITVNDSECSNLLLWCSWSGNWKGIQPLRISLQQVQENSFFNVA